MLRKVAAVVRPPIFQGASRERDAVVAALDRMELPRERFPSQVVEERVGELRRAEELLRLNALRLERELSRPLFRRPVLDVGARRTELDRDVVEGRTMRRLTPRDLVAELLAVVRLWKGLDRLRPEVDGLEMDGRLVGRAVRVGVRENDELRRAELVRPDRTEDRLVDGRETLRDRDVEGREKLRLLRAADRPADPELRPRLKPDRPALDRPALDRPPDRPRI